ncbi:InlB B-repeat-containing protein [bacterium]|nr:InlB B-repeat-containing protein [bacterium]
MTIPSGSVGNKSYNAVWSLNTYTITYNLNGGSVSQANSTSYTIESADITLNNPTKTGYTFL